jgi:nucleoside-diphosphate-sugar epimerase
MQTWSEQNAPRVLVTGANGFLGSELVRQLAGAGMQLRASDRSEASCFSGVDYCLADILNLRGLRPVLAGIEGVIHAAGLAHVFDRAKVAMAPFKAVNEIGTANVARAAAQAGVSHFVLVSSVSVYGDRSSGNDETAACCPQGPYAESKWLAEQRAIEIAQTSGMALTILRLATLYGEGDPGNVARLMRTLDRGRFMWVGDGSNRKSLIHRDDAARACVTALRSPGAGLRVFNVSSPACTMRDVVEYLAVALNRSVPPWRIPASVATGLVYLAARLSGGHLRSLYMIVQKWLADDVYDARKFEVTFGFRAQVGLAEGLRREVEWYRGQEAYKR